MLEQGLRPFQCQWPKQVHKPTQYDSSLTLFLKEKGKLFIKNIHSQRTNRATKGGMAQLQIHVALKADRTSLVGNRML